MSMTIVILMTVMMSGGAVQQVKSSETYPTMEACEAAKAGVEEQYKREHPGAKVQKAECTKS